MITELTVQNGLVFFFSVETSTQRHILYCDIKKQLSVGNCYWTGTLAEKLTLAVAIF